MQTDPGVSAALQPFARRARVVAFLKYAMVAVPIAVIAGESLWLAGIRRPLALAALIVAAVTVSAVAALRHQRPLIAVARRVDARAHLQDLVVSAAGSRGDGLASLVRRDAIAALKQQSPRAVYPVELPARWRQLAAAALVIEAVMLAMVWQAPAERAAAPSLTSLVLPSSPNTSTASARPSPERTSDGARSAPESTPLSNGATVAPSGRRGIPVIVDPPGAAPSAAVTSAGDRLRLATLNAETDLSAGRVPVARRAIVERYFAALQSQRKTPR